MILRGLSLRYTWQTLLVPYVYNVINIKIWLRAWLHFHISYGLRGGEITLKKTRNRAPAFGHKTDFCCIQQPSGTLSDGFYVLHHMLEYRPDQQNLRMSPRSGDANILQWAKKLGYIPDHRLRAEFYHIQRELAQIIMNDVLGKTGMFDTSPTYL